MWGWRRRSLPPLPRRRRPLWTKAPLRFTSSRWATSEQGDASEAGTTGQANRMRQTHCLCCCCCCWEKTATAEETNKKKKKGGEKSSTIPLFLFLLQLQSLFASAPLHAAPPLGLGDTKAPAQMEAGGLQPSGLCQHPRSFLLFLLPLLLPLRRPPASARRGAARRGLAGWRLRGRAPRGA